MKFIFRRGVAVFSASIFIANFSLLISSAQAQVMTGDSVTDAEQLDSASTTPEVLEGEESKVTEPEEASDQIVDAAEAVPASGEESPSSLEFEAPETQIDPTNLSNDLYSDYLLGPGDQIRIDILGYEAFNWA